MDAGFLWVEPDDYQGKKMACSFGAAPVCSNNFIRWMSAHYTSPFLRTGPAIFLWHGLSATCKVRWVCWPLLKTVVYSHVRLWLGRSVWAFLRGAWPQLYLRLTRILGTPGWMQRRTSVACDPRQASSCRGLGRVCFCTALLAVRRRLLQSALLPSIQVTWVMAEDFSCGHCARTTNTSCVSFERLLMGRKPK